MQLTFALKIPSHQGMLRRSHKQPGTLHKHLSVANLLPVYVRIKEKLNFWTQQTWLKKRYLLKCLDRRKRLLIDMSTQDYLLEYLKGIFPQLGPSRLTFFIILTIIQASRVLGSYNHCLPLNLSSRIFKKTNSHLSWPEPAWPYEVGIQNILILIFLKASLVKKLGNTRILFVIPILPFEYVLRNPILFFFIFQTSPWKGKRSPTHKQIEAS